MSASDERPRSPAAPRGRNLLFGTAGALAAFAYGVGVAKLGFDAPLVMLAFGGFALALCGLALFRIIDPLLRTDAPIPEVRQTPVRRKELEREKNLVLKAIREIEHDHQMRKISDADHKEMTARYRARAMRILREIDAGDDYRALIEQELKTRLAVKEATRRGCPVCRAPNEEDAVYCKKCGKPLAPAADAAASNAGADGGRPV